MQTKFSLYILISLFCYPLWGQAYKPLLDDFNEWHFTTCFFGCLTDVYYTNGDTIVNGKNHKVLDGFHYISRTFLLNEEVADKQVFLTLVDPPNSTEYLLYDFSLAVGDSIDMKNPITPFPEDAGYYKLDSIVLRPLVDSNEYRHFYLSPAPSNTTSTTNAVWIEGVGSLSLITAPSGDPDINGVGALSCFFKEAELFYSNLDSITACEPVILNLNPAVEILPELEVSTLVSKDFCLLNNASRVKFADVFDLNGRRLKSIDNSGENRISIDFSTYKSGVYVMVVYDRNFRKKTYKILVD
jgi:hypothetical protein